MEIKENLDLNVNFEEFILVIDIDFLIKIENICLNKNEIIDEFKDLEEDECFDFFVVSKVIISFDSIEEFDKV